MHVEVLFELMKELSIMLNDSGVLNYSLEITTLMHFQINGICMKNIFVVQCHSNCCFPYVWCCFGLA